MAKTILRHREGNTLVLTINRPKALNALNVSVFDELNSIFIKGKEDLSDISSIILTGSGDRAFAAGADIMEFPKMNQEMGEDLSHRGHRIFNAIESFHKPVIAVINGFALGGGCELAMACHLRIVEEHAKFGQPEVNLGLIPGYAGTQRLKELIGKTKAMEFLLTGDMIDAQTADQLGLVNKICSKGEGMAEALKLASKLARKAPTAMAYIIEVCNTRGRKGFKKEIRRFGECFGTEEMLEGVTAFLEKRKPDFKK
jgi:enoyl-CoA hydratase